MRKPGIPIDQNISRQLESTNVANMSLRPSILKRKLKKRRKLLRMQRAIEGLQVPPSSPSHPTSLDLSSWIPYWNISISGSNFSANWTDSENFQIQNGKIKEPPIYATNCEFNVAYSSGVSQVMGNASFKIHSEEKLKEFIPLLRINNPARIEMGWSTELNSKLGQGWDPRSAYKDAMGFSSDLKVLNNEVNLDPDTGVWSVSVQFSGFSNFLLSSLHLNDLTIDDREGNGFRGWFANNIAVNPETAQESEYLRVVSSGQGSASATVVKITTLGIAATLNQLMKVILKDTEIGGSVRKKLYNSGGTGGAALVEKVPEFIVDEQLQNDALPLSTFVNIIQDKGYGRLRMSDILSTISDKLTEANKISDGGTSADRSGRNYFFLPEWDDSINKGQSGDIITLTSVGAQIDEENPSDIPALTISNQFSWLRSFSVSQSPNAAITAKALLGEDRIEGVDVGEESLNKENSAEEGSAEKPVDISKEIFLYPFSATATLQGLAGFRLLQQLYISGIGGEDLYDGLYQVSGIKYVANESGWLTNLEFQPDVSKGTFPNIKAILARHEPPTKTTNDNTSERPASSKENLDYSSSDD